MRRRARSAIFLLLLALPAIAAADALDGALGKALFDRVWVQAPASTKADDGLGPLFNEKSCAACHSGKALSARLAAGPGGRLAPRGLVTRLGDAEGRPDLRYGRQWQTRAVAGLESEGTIAYRLAARKGGPPRLDIAPLRGPLDPATKLGPRQAPPLRGVHEIGMVDADAVAALAAAEAARGDGISGRPRWLEVDGRRMLGRYGWKASAATLDQQVSDAFMLDIGMSSPLSPHPSGDCTAAEADCLAAPDGRSPAFDDEELSGQMVHLVAAYLDSLKVPRPVSPEPPGAALFEGAGCAACHVPSLAAKGGGTVRLYSDLLLHDMGAGLDDGVGEPGVASSEWRTPPLLALSLRKDTDQRYLHDGRAATLDAAVRAHGGEALGARANYEKLSAADRAALIAFLETL